MKIGAVFVFAMFTVVGPLSAQEKVDYLHDIKPIFKARCFACHGAVQQKGKLRLDTGELVRKGGRHGPAAKPGDLAGSLLLERVTAKEETERMPPEGKPLSDEQIGKLKAWIAQGAKSPSDEQPEADPRDHWAFQKPVRPAMPKVKRTEWVRNPVDAFVLAEMEKRGLAPNPEADKQVLLRRLYIDLIGLPPTRAEVEAFLGDKSADAYEKVVDRLLSSKLYGERYGRHWMDVWRYSDWYGRRSVPDNLNSYGMIWRWRDWIVNSIDADRPYDRMVQEMFAADEICPTDDANLVATGFIVRNYFRWNYDQWMKDAVEHSGKAFLGLTLNCCQCHDHKYDPITQDEYFNFRAFFEPIEIRHDRVPGEPDPGPYPKYVYGSSNKAITSGMVRIFDEKLDAKTLMYAGGDPRLVIKGKPPATPGGPAIVHGDKLEVKPVELPTEAWYPAFKPHLVKEELERHQQAIKSAEKELADSGAVKIATNMAVAKQKLQVARLGLESFQTRLAADEEKIRKGGKNLAALSRAASKAERTWAVEKARLVKLQSEHALEQARKKLAGDAKVGDAKFKAEVGKLEKQLKANELAIAQAEKNLAADSDKYTPLGQQFPAKSTGRRTALARWLTNPDNPLTARVAVNHMWAWHFGEPIVATPANFGRSGKPPTHPALLDWLAMELMQPTLSSPTRAGDKNPWTMRRLHRLMVTSNAYRMRSHAEPDDTRRKIDPDNHYLWHYPVRRMEAEVIRDSVLYLAGKLDMTMGGPELPHEQGLTNFRRSMYFSSHGEGQMKFLELFDAVNPCDGYERSDSVMPQQALALFNSDLVAGQARVLAFKLWQESGDNDETFVRNGFLQVLGRSPSAPEASASLGFLQKQRQLFQASGLKTAPPAATNGAAPSPDPGQRARENFVHALFNHNDFVTVR